MYLRATKALLTDALRKTLDGDYVNPIFRNILVSIEYPEERQNYPSVWVDFEPIGELEAAGIDHAEYRLSGGGTAVRHTRWRFQGFATYTVVALSSLERDGLFDEVVRIFAFGKEHMSTKVFRQVIEDNPLVAMNMDFGTIGQRGFASSPGTPWQTDEIIYEATIAMNVIGEVVADVITGDLVPISQFIVTDIAQHEQDPSPGW